MKQILVALFGYNRLEFQGNQQDPPECCRSRVTNVKSNPSEALCRDRA